MRAIAGSIARDARAVKTKTEGCRVAGDGAVR
jgi:hypothetical protein